MRGIVCEQVECSFLLDNWVDEFFKKVTGLRQLHADMGYSTKEIKTTVLLSTHLHSTHRVQVLLTVVKGCQRL